MKIKLFTIGILITVFSCQSAQTTKSINENEQQSAIHKIVVKEVLQTSNYTYLRVKEGDKGKWLATSLMEAKAGEIYYYDDAMIMTNFESKELKRNFDTIYFLSSLTTEPIKNEKISEEENHLQDHVDPSSENNSYSKNSISKKEMKIKPVVGGITIAELYSKKEFYNGKKVKIKGEVTKFNPDIMYKNWIHLQDGTEYIGKFDLTVTTDKEVKPGNIIIVEGKITLNKDLGHGYFFEIIMEEANILNTEIH